ncbi:hypothetical protein D3C71_1522210 [compost metagenome]
MFRLDVKTVDVVEQAIEGFHYHRHIPVHRVVGRQRFTFQRDQAVTYHADAVGVGEGDWAGEQAGFADPLQPGGVAIAVEHMHAGKAGGLPGLAGTRFDHRDAGTHAAPVGQIGVDAGVADANAGHVGDGVQRAGNAVADFNAQILSALRHGYSPSIEGSTCGIACRGRI